MKCANNSLLRRLRKRATKAKGPRMISIRQYGIDRYLDEVEQRQARRFAHDRGLIPLPSLSPTEVDRILHRTQRLV